MLEDEFERIYDPDPMTGHWEGTPRPVTSRLCDGPGRGNFDLKHPAMTSCINAGDNSRTHSALMVPVNMRMLLSL